MCGFTLEWCCVIELCRWPTAAPFVFMSAAILIWMSTTLLSSVGLSIARSPIFCLLPPLLPVDTPNLTRSGENQLEQGVMICTCILLNSSSKEAAKLEQNTELTKMITYANAEYPLPALAADRSAA